MNRIRFNNQRIFVTGATGFIGRALVEELFRQGFLVKALVRDAQRVTFFPQTEVVINDVTAAPDKLAVALSGVDTVVHLAGVVWGNQDQMHCVMVKGTANLIEAMQQAGVPHLLLASSLAVYDWSRVAGKLTEGEPLASTDSGEQGAYAQAKVRQEAIARQLCRQYGIRLTVLRPAAVVAEDNYATADLGPRFGPVQFVLAPMRRLRLVGLVSVVAAFVEASCVPLPDTLAINLVDNRRLTAWNFAKGVPGRAPLLLPLPYFGLKTLAWLVFQVAQLAGVAHYLPNLFVPTRLLARLKSADYDNALWRRWLPLSAEISSKSKFI